MQASHSSGGPWAGCDSRSGGQRAPELRGRGSAHPPASVSPQVPVPRHSVGVVIGRSGEMIKKIQNDAGVRIQFKQGQGPGRKDELGGGWLCLPALSSGSPEAPLQIARHSGAC